MFSLVDRNDVGRTSSGVSIDSLGDKAFLQGLHGHWDILCHCCRPPIKMVVKHRRDTDTYFLSSFPDSPLHQSDCPLFRQRKTLLPDVFVPVSRIDFFNTDKAPSTKDADKALSLKDTLSDVPSSKDMGEASSVKDTASSPLPRKPLRTSVQVITPSVMESLLITLTYNSFSHIHFGSFVTVKDFAEKLKGAAANTQITFPNGTSVTDGLFFGEKGLIIAKKHARQYGAALWLRLASHVAQDKNGLMVNDKKLSTQHVEWPYKAESNAWMIMALVNDNGVLDTTLVYPVCDMRHVVPYQREAQRTLITTLSPLIYGMNNSKTHRFYLSTPLHSIRHEDSYLIADMIVTRKNKGTGVLHRLVLGQSRLDELSVAYDAKAYYTSDIIMRPESIKALLNE